MDPGEDEGRRDHPAGGAQAPADALGQGGLARAEVAGGDDHVSGFQQPGQPSAQVAHGDGGRYLDHHRQRLGQDHPVGHVVVVGEAAVPPEGDQLGQLLPGQQLHPLVALPGGQILGGDDHGRGDPVPLEVRVHRHPGERGHAIPAGQNQDRSGGPAAHLGVDASPASQAPGHRGVVSSLAVDGGSRAGRAPNAAWITSTIPVASSTDATDTTRSETETLTSGHHLGCRGVQRGRTP